MMFSGDLSKKKIGVLSGGEKSRVLLGQIVARPCNLLLLDEPTHHLDIESIEALIDALEDFSGSVVIVTHSELILRRLELDQIVVCEEGRQTVFRGNYDEFLEKIGWQEEKKTGEVKKAPALSRRERAESVAEQAAKIKPVQRQIEELEKRLSSLEMQQQKDQEILSSEAIDPDVIKRVGLRQKEIEGLEAELYAFYELLDKLKS